MNAGPGLGIHRERRRRICRTRLLSLLLAPMLIGASPRIVFARDGWASFDRGSSCDAVSRAERIASEPDEQAHAGFVFDRAGPRHGQFAALLARPIAPGATVILTIGDRPFLLAARDRFAWSRGPGQEGAIIGAARTSSAMRIEARAPDGGRFADRYGLAGAAGAIDAAAACSVGR